MRNTGNTVAGTVSCSMSVNSASYTCNVMFVRQRYFSMAQDGEEKREKIKEKITIQPTWKLPIIGGKENLKLLV